MRISYGDSMLRETYGDLLKNSENLKFVVKTSVFAAAKTYYM